MQSFLLKKVRLRIIVLILFLLFDLTILNAQTDSTMHYHNRSELSHCAISPNPLPSRSIGISPETALQDLIYMSYVYTFKELYVFSYFENTEIVVTNEDGNVLWQGVLDRDSYEFMDLGEGVYQTIRSDGIGYFYR